MIDLIAAAGIGGIIGAGIMAWRTAGKVADVDFAKRAAIAEWRDDADDARDNEAAANRKAIEFQDAHTRCADALTTTQRKLSAIRDLLDAPRTIRKGELAMILDGEIA